MTSESVRQLRVAMMALLTEEELAALVSRLEQQELDCQTGSGTVSSEYRHVSMSRVMSRVTCPRSLSPCTASCWPPTSPATPPT